MTHTAELIAVGTELLLGNICNTDAQMISQTLSGLGINVYYHTVVGDNPARVRAAVEGLADGMNLHDFRLVRGVKTKAVFEVGIPFGSPVKDAELQNDIERAVRILGDYEPVVTVERE